MAPFQPHPGNLEPQLPGSGSVGSGGAKAQRSAAVSRTQSAYFPSTAPRPKAAAVGWGERSHPREGSTGRQAASLRLPPPRFPGRWRQPPPRAKGAPLAETPGDEAHHSPQKRRSVQRDRKRVTAGPVAETHELLSRTLERAARLSPGFGPRGAGAS